MLGAQSTLLGAQPTLLGAQSILPGAQSNLLGAQSILLGAQAQTIFNTAIRGKLYFTSYPYFCPTNYLFITTKILRQQLTATKTNLGNRLNIKLVLYLK